MSQPEMSPINDAKVFVELSTSSRIAQILLLSGRKPRQIEAIMGRNTVIDALIFNTSAGTDPIIKEHCTRQVLHRVVGELDKYPAWETPNPWSNLQTGTLICSTVKPPTYTPVAICEEIRRRRVISPTMVEV